MMLPLTQVSRRGRRTTVWGQVRPGTGPREYQLQSWNGSRWVVNGGLHETTVRGYLLRVVSAGRGAMVRLWYPARASASPTLVVR